MSIEELIGEKPATAGNCSRAPKLQQQMDRVTHLPKMQQRFIMQVIDFIAQAAR